MRTGSLKPYQLTARGAIAEMRAGRLTSETLVRDCLQRIAEREALVHAWSHLDPDISIRAAHQLDAAPRRGLLHGIPIGIKDVVDTYDMPSEYGPQFIAVIAPPRTPDASRWLVPRAQ